MVKKGEQYPAFSNVKLEGPRKHHNDHGVDASNPAASKAGDKNPAGSGHWEMPYSTCAASENMRLTAGDDFIAKRGRDRKTTHLKVNETDH